MVIYKKVTMYVGMRVPDGLSKEGVEKEKQKMVWKIEEDITYMNNDSIESYDNAYTISDLTGHDKKSIDFKILEKRMEE